ncbi:MAG: gluconate 2-dehydrogenase subunit 3 family protein [Verrucomicrobiales bacterium]|nr:gluconate 2-dehydrogenase subunit 3 family protein [Verrucomicrobiales bacterium]
MIDRRSAIERITLILGGSISTQLSAGLMGQVINQGPVVEVDEAKKAFLAELADIIIPNTDTPGAKAAGVENFIIRVMRDCYELEHQKNFYGGLEKLDKDCRSSLGKPFVELALVEKNDFFKSWIPKNRWFFKQMKQLTVAGYFTSEIGATQALAYLPIPGRFEGDVPLAPGQKAWAISR